ncbi:MAG: YdeI/OmpD-associated family protein [Bacteroidia bacterium]
MEITEIFYPEDRQAWRDWLQTHHQTKTEVWLQRYVKASGRPSISYDALVEECLCFGWIDGVVKKRDADSNVQRITPRRKKSFLSELNRQRVWKLRELGLMTPAGEAALGDQVGSPDDPWEIPAWIREQLVADPRVWEQFRAFPPLYQRLKIGWVVETGKTRREEAQRRLDHLIAMTRKGRRYGTEPLS